MGAGGLGRVVLEFASSEYDCAFLDDGPEVGTLVDGAPVIGRTSELDRFFPSYKRLAFVIGNNRLREKLYKTAERIGYDFPNLVFPSAFISPYASMGRGCIVLNNAVVQNGARIGNGVILSSGSEAHHDSSIGDFCVVYSNSVVRSLTHVGDRVWIGSTATVSTFAVVPDDTVIEDGAVFKAG